MKINIEGLQANEITVDDLYGFWADSEELFFVTYDEKTKNVYVSLIENGYCKAFSYKLKKGQELSSELDIISQLTSQGLRPVNVDIKVK